MKTATQNLENDHDHILLLTDVMQSMVENETGTIEHFELVVNLIRKFADGIHHAKEEDLLFPLMGEKGYSPTQGPVAVMLNEHVQGRNFVAGMVEGIRQMKEGDATAIDIVYDQMSGYAELLQQHIGKENNVLFRMADQVFSAAEQQDLLEQFAIVEKEAPADFNSESSIKAINELAAIYLNS